MAVKAQYGHLRNESDDIKIVMREFVRSTAGCWRLSRQTSIRLSSFVEAYLSLSLPCLPPLSLSLSLLFPPPPFAPLLSLSHSLLSFLTASLSHDIPMCMYACLSVCLLVCTCLSICLYLSTYASPPLSLSTHTPPSLY